MRIRWTLRDVLIAVAWLSVGMAAFRFVWMKASPRAIDSIGLRMLLHLAGGAAVGAGVGTLFKEPRQFALVGLCLALVAFCCFSLVVFRIR